MNFDWNLMREIFLYIGTFFFIIVCLVLTISVVLQRGEEGAFKKFSTVHKTVSSGGVKKVTIISSIFFMLMPLVFYGLMSKGTIYKKDRSSPGKKIEKSVVV